MTSTVEAGAEEPATDNRWTIAIFALVGLGMGLLLYSLGTPTYETESLVTINNPIGTLADEVAVATSPAVLGAAEAILGYPPQVTITAADVASLLTVTATAGDPQAAKDTADIVASTYVSAQTNTAATVAQAAELPTSRSGLPVLAFAALGTIVGAALGAVVQMLQGRRPSPAASVTGVVEQSGSSEVEAQPSGVGIPNVAEDEDQPSVDLRESASLNPQSLDPQSLDPQPLAPQPRSAQALDTQSVDTQVLGADPWRPDRATSGAIWSEPSSAAFDSSLVETVAARDATITPLASSTPPQRPAEPSPPTQAPRQQAPASPGQATPGHEPPNPNKPPAYTPQSFQPEPLASPPPSEPPPSEPPPSLSEQPSKEPATMPPVVTHTLTAETPASEAGSFSNASFSDAASSESTIDITSGDAFHDDLGPASFADLSELDRRALRAQYETLKYELELKHQQELAHADAERERQTAELRSEITDLNKQLRVQSARLQNRAGRNHSRVGDLEAQVDALEIELAGIRQQLEAERIAHTKRLTEERGTADRALDNARREYREELAKHLHTHRATLAAHRTELDQTLADDRAKQAANLAAAHAEYEKAHEADRSRAEAKHTSNNQRHQREMASLTESTKQELERQTTQHKDTIEALRERSESNDNKLRELEKENRLIRAELSNQQKQARHNDTENTTAVQRLNDELSVTRSELDGERERNAALRADVLRRSAEAHQVIDRAVAERTAQLAELESSVARQREYADARVREISASAEEQARQSTMREAKMTATISRLKREVEELSAKLRT